MIYNFPPNYALDAQVPFHQVCSLVFADSLLSLQIPPLSVPLSPEFHGAYWAATGERRPEIQLHQVHFTGGFLHPVLCLT